MRVIEAQVQRSETTDVTNVRQSGVRPERFLLRGSTRLTAARPFIHKLTRRTCHRFTLNNDLHERARALLRGHPKTALPFRISKKSHLQARRLVG